MQGSVMGKEEGAGTMLAAVVAARGTVAWDAGEGRPRAVEMAEEERRRVSNVVGCISKVV